ncbi:EAL domain-containing protein [Aliivibrio sp. S4TY2]|uniref:EAL domain-containing protein n=1 Tax=unclassified Aliivibrio TaxID=2645654 RepID=UPI002378D8BB|nr:MULTISPECIES: EAL domain-containing protein [unclassified Aliivibrio]MDD9156727.1 EAL domain-containing protein [Aliivibrio sp. S4TY2]MDD9160213.1 EAL domain-containing protein [Aliivibrio sp. S4TY1]MDD9164494.1 EAL domain-containing protein [Aliivibrio sp. S4MY2]MDD9168636.1 EAL domain-containing protein [Aliivibrio sp. S4MY4]MDD9184829.1 EAL domain-containing protein [Aliivibrio sp. S4MY3]
MKITKFELKNALDNNEFVFFYQPQVCFVTGKLKGAEALIRWMKSDGGLIMPNDFISLAEENGFLNNITLNMLDILANDSKKFLAINDKLNISINISVKSLYCSKILNKIERLITSGSLRSENFSIEITESTLFEYNSLNSDALNLFDYHKIQLVMDDFGTGFSNLCSLNGTPFSKIKFDYSLIKDVGKNDKSTAIIIENIKMAHKLQLETVAEGVENDETYRILKDNGCSLAQGFLISKAVCRDDFISDFIRADHTFPHSPLGLVKLAKYSYIEWVENVIDFSIKKIRTPRTMESSDLLLNSNCGFLGNWKDDNIANYIDEKMYYSLNKAYMESYAIAKELIITNVENITISIERHLILTNKLIRKESLILSILLLLENMLKLTHKCN